MTIIEIKAKLYDLRSHICDGRITLRSDGSTDPRDHSCHGCSRTMELLRMLEEAQKPGGPDA